MADDGEKHQLQYHCIISRCSYTCKNIVIRNIKKELCPNCNTFINYFGDSFKLLTLEDGFSMDIRHVFSVFIRIHDMCSDAYYDEITDKDPLKSLFCKSSSEYNAELCDVIKKLIESPATDPEYADRDKRYLSYIANRLIKEWRKTKED